MILFASEVPKYIGQNFLPRVLPGSTSTWKKKAPDRGKEGSGRGGGIIKG